MVCDELRNIKHGIAYLSDVFTKFKEVNLQLQGNDVNLIKAKSAISTFLSKLQLFKRNIAHHELYQFPSLLNWRRRKAYQIITFKCIVHTWISCKRTCLRDFRIFYCLKYKTVVINPFLDVNSKETGVAEKELYCLPNIIFSRTGLQWRSHLASFQANKQIENY